MTDQNLKYENGYALFIGIRYGHWTNVRPLNGTLNDVEGLYNHFTDVTKAAYNPENIITLKEGEATAKNILKALDDLATKVNGNPDAFVIIYYAGHGETDTKNYFLVPYDFNLPLWQLKTKFEAEKVVLSTDFAKKIAAIQAKKVLTILDCCHSENMPVERGGLSGAFLGGFVEDLENGIDENPQQRDLSTQISKGSGRVILTSCQANEKSLDLGSNGLFTEVLLESLSGTKNIENDGWVRLLDIMRYVPNEVARRAKELGLKHRQNLSQNPVFKRIENLTAEEFIISAYDIQQARGLKGSELIEPKQVFLQEQTTMTKEEILKLIDTDIDAALDALDNIWSDNNATYNDYNREYTNQPNNFSLDNFRSRLKRLVKRNLK